MVVTSTPVPTGPAMTVAEALSTPSVAVGKAPVGAPAATPPRPTGQEVVGRTKA